MARNLLLMGRAGAKPSALFILGALFAVGSLACSSPPRDLQPNAVTDCPVTLPVPRDAIPETVARTILAGSSNPDRSRLSMYGNEFIWVVVHEDGVSSGVPHDGGVFDKFPTVPLISGELTAEVTRIDGSAPPPEVMIEGGATEGGSLWILGVHFPTTGCWQITQRIADKDLRFVVKVETLHRKIMPAIHKYGPRR